MVPKLSFYHVGLCFRSRSRVTFTGTPDHRPPANGVEQRCKGILLDKDLVIPAQCTISVAPVTGFTAAHIPKLDTNAATVNTSNAYAAPFIIGGGIGIGGHERLPHRYDG